ncbi:magnesium transporter [Sandarakinorhabdus sp. DWP1-3-1]|uniref:magnesium transporter n=1 Tax=Sandarakinorhabdus sp. DWP1-3-1 TaxID=2804627 RepID=UPI003CF1BEF3
MVEPTLYPDADIPREALEEGRLTRAYVEDVIDALDTGNDETARTLVAPLHPADIADLFALVPEDYRARLARAIGEALDADVIAELDDYVRDDVLAAMSVGEVADLVTQLDTDDAVALIEDLEDDEQREVLDALTPSDRADIEAALNYAEETAGRLMQRELVAVNTDVSVGQVIDQVRATIDPATDFWEIFVIDAERRPVGTMRLSWLLTTPPDIAVTDVMQREQTLIPVDMDQEEVALQFQKYALISAAVVDGNGRLVGVITVDDIVHIIQEEAGEDALKLSGAGDGDINEPVFDTFKVRVVWLLVNLGTAVLAAMVISAFEGTIAQMVTLAALMPIVASMGGNAGTQTMAVAVRALATNQLTDANARRAVLREVRISLLNGATLAVLIGIGVGTIFHSPLLGVVIGSAMLINNLVAGLAGMMIPLGLERAGVDPAVSSAVFVTMCTDIMGFFVFLGLATLVGVGRLG